MSRKTILLFVIALSQQTQASPPSFNFQMQGGLKETLGKLCACLAIFLSLVNNWISVYSLVFSGFHFLSCLRVLETNSSISLLYCRNFSNITLMKKKPGLPFHL